MSTPRFLTWALAELLRPRRVRYSVRSLAIFVTLLALVLGLYIVPARRTQQAVDALQAAGCELRWDYQFTKGKWNREAASTIHRDFLALSGPAYFHRVVELSCPQLDAVHTRAARKSLATHLPALTHLTSLELASGAADESVLAAVGRLSRLQSLTLVGPEITDQGLAHLSRLARLHTLSLQSSKITDDGVARLKTLTSLRTFQLSTTSSPLSSVRLEMSGFSSFTIGRVPGAEPTSGLTNESFRTLGQLSSLVSINVQSDVVSSAGLVHLQGQSHLESLQIGGAADELTPEALTSLQALPALRRLALPQTEIPPAMLASLQRSNPGLKWIVAQNITLIGERIMPSPLRLFPGPAAVGPGPVLPHFLPPSEQ
jgi:hypothetical protein